MERDRLRHETLPKTRNMRMKTTQRIIPNRSSPRPRITFSVGRTYQDGCLNYSDLKIMKSFAPLKPSSRWAWHGPGREYHNQIDCIMINRRFQSSVNIALKQEASSALMLVVIMSVL
ncbi:hypothetical protein ElyMa_000003100 [Elysia marginata]|uniref:Uncharacterized protein n=1 Tax=Elysia marginata TaxID=1093978 RepID=A0AAV4E8L7_9GAST|nr:hypothetical protein ElyMa_000003100 [Elysia marginata]